MESKTLGQIAYEAVHGKWATWEAEIFTRHERWEAAAQAVLRAAEQVDEDDIILPPAKRSGTIKVTLTRANPPRSSIAPDPDVLNNPEFAEPAKVCVAAPWRPWGPVDPKIGLSVIAWREDAGSFEATFVFPRMPAGEEPEDGMWFTAGGDDLTSDPPTLFMDMPQPDTALIAAARKGKR